MQRDAPVTSERDGETPDERHNRQLVELLNELRVALPGVQVLFGFLLAVPFSTRFGDITHTERMVYFGTFVAAALASACLIAPASFHRIVWRRGQKERLLHISSGLAIVGTGFLAISISGSVALVTSFLFGGGAAVVAAAIVAAILAGLWFALPMAYRIARRPGADL
jgi:hypothetical protein